MKTLAPPVSLALVALALGIILWQARQNAVLQRETTLLRESIKTPAFTGPGSDLKRSPTDTSTASPLPPTLSTDLESATLKEILAHPNPMERIRRLLDYVETLPPHAIARALAELRAGSPDWDPEARFLAHMLLTRWGQEDPDAAFASLENMDFKRSGGDATSVLASLAALDPQRAIAWLNDPENTLQHLPKMGHILAGTIAREWVRQDPQAALEWAQSLPDDQRHGALGGVITSLAGSDPEAAADMVLSMEANGERQGYLGAVAQAWGKQDPQRALEWADTLPPTERVTAVEELLDGWAQTDPAQAAAYVDALPLDERSQSQISQVGREWARRDPAAAAAWLDRQPEGKGRERTMGELMWNWTTMDPQSASAWLAQQPGGQSRDIGAAALAKAAIDSDPEGALSWASTINNEDLRTEMFHHGMRTWMERDPNSARTWANQNGVALPEKPPTEK